MVKEKDFESLYSLLLPSLNYLADFGPGYIQERNGYLLDIFTSYVESKFILWKQKHKQECLLHHDRNNLKAVNIHEYDKEWSIMIFYFLFKRGKEFLKTFAELKQQVKTILENLEPYLTCEGEYIRNIAKKLLLFPIESRIDILESMIVIKPIF